VSSWVELSCVSGETGGGERKEGREGLDGKAKGKILELYGGETFMKEKEGSFGKRVFRMDLD
jgi:hypothetical protein